MASQVTQLVKNPSANSGDAGDVSSVPALGRSPGVGNGNPLQYSCLDSPVDGRAGGLQSLGLQSRTRLSLHVFGTVSLLYSYTLQLLVIVTTLQSHYFMAMPSCTVITVL